MNRSSKATRFIVAFTGALIVVAATWKVRHPSDATRNEAGRTIASHRSDSLKKARLEKSEDSGNENKAKGSFAVVISADDGLGGPATENTLQPATRVHLKGRVTADRHIASQDFTWILPQNYKVIDGATSGVVPELQPGQSHEMRITVDRGAEPVQPVVLHVFKIINAEPRGQIAQFDIVDPRAEKSSINETAEKSANRLRDQTFVQ